MIPIQKKKRQWELIANRYAPSLKTKSDVSQNRFACKVCLVSSSSKEEKNMQKLTVALGWRCYIQQKWQDFAVQIRNKHVKVKQVTISNAVFLKLSTNSLTILTSKMGASWIEVVLSDLTIGMRYKKDSESFRIRVQRLPPFHPLRSLTLEESSCQVMRTLE